MALNEAEKQLMQIAADNAVQARDAAIRTETIVKTHSTQIENLFTQGRVHADAISVLKTQHDLCAKNNEPGNLAERTGNKIAIAAIVISTVLGGLGFGISATLAVKAFIGN